MHGVPTKNQTRGQTVKQGAFLVSTFRMASGEEMPLVVHRETRMPHVYALRFVIVLHRLTGSSANSIGNVCQGIALGLSFLHSRDIDLVDRLSSGRFFTRDELATFANRCLQRADGQGAVVTHYAKMRYDDFVEYVLWRFEAILHRANDQNRALLIEERRQFEKRVAAQRPKARAGAAEKERLGLSETQRALLLDVIHPDSPRNPFAPKLRRRNRALILIHYRYGLRAGELLGLYRSDYKNLENPPQLFIHIRDNNPEDSRARPARTKTRARMLEIGGDARDALDVWIDHRADRIDFPLSRKSRFLFVNEDGFEISLRAALGIFERLRDVYPELAGFASHVLRHDMNERYVEAAEKEGWDEKQVAEDQRYLNGWSEESEQPSRYSSTAIRNRSNRRIYKLQKKSVD